jgi:hypothetical protein
MPTKMVGRYRRSAQPSRSARRTFFTRPGTRPPREPIPEARRDYTEGGPGFNAGASRASAAASFSAR